MARLVDCRLSASKTSCQSMFYYLHLTCPSTTANTNNVLYCSILYLEKASSSEISWSDFKSSSDCFCICKH